MANKTVNWNQHTCLRACNQRLSQQRKPLFIYLVFHNKLDYTDSVFCRLATELNLTLATIITWLQKACMQIKIEDSL